MAKETLTEAHKQVEQFHDIVNAVRTELKKVIVGQDQVIEGLLVAYFAGGHLLLEGLPGLGKTLLAKAFSQTLGFEFKRIQCTPDLMPADILGTQLVVDLDGHKSFEFAAGPVFTHLLLADEINRATPKTQSALLEAMEERQVTVAGKTYRLSELFFVMATQNPIEMEGVFPLPEAQLDRFFLKLKVAYPSHEQVKDILKKPMGLLTDAIQSVLPKAQAEPHVLAMRRLAREVLVASSLEECVAQLIRSTHPEVGHPEGLVTKYVRYGASPRGAQALLLAAKVAALLDGRVNVSFEDVERWAIPVLNHRLILSFEAEVDRVSAEQILADLLKRLPRNGR